MRELEQDPFPTGIAWLCPRPPIPSGAAHPSPVLEPPRRAGSRGRRAKGTAMACGSRHAELAAAPGRVRRLPALTALALFVLGPGQLLAPVPACFSHPGLTNLFSVTHAGKMTVSFPQFPHLRFVLLSLPFPRFGKEFRNVERCSNPG